MHDVVHSGGVGAGGGGWSSGSWWCWCFGVWWSKVAQGVGFEGLSRNCKNKSKYA